MPVKVKKSGSKYIVVEAKTGRKTRSSGRFTTKAKAQRQANAINRNLKKRQK